MRRMWVAGPLAAMVVLVAGAGCTSKGAPAGSGLVPNSPTAGSSAGQTTPTKPASTKTTSSSSDWPTPEDCVSYNPSNLSVTSSPGVYLITDGSTVVMRLHGQVDQVGQQGLALAQRYRKHCFLGRNNSRGDMKGDYIFDYWRDPTGQATTVPDEENICSPYNNRNLTVEDMGGGDGWRVKDHDHVLHLFDTGADARNGKLVLLKYSQVCSIGDIDDTDSDLGTVSYAK